MSRQLSMMLLDEAAKLERRKNRARRNQMRRSKWDAFDMPNKDFVKSFRLTKAMVRHLINDLTPYLDTERRHDAFSAKDNVLLALSFYATGSYQTGVGQSIYHAVSQPSVSRAIKQVTLALNVIFRKYVVFPTKREDRDKIKRKFYEKYRMPGVVGCIDGTHVAIIRPSQYEERYFNRKGYHSLNVMIICDMELNILCVDPSHPGATHDSTVWREHSLNDYLKQLSNNGELIYLLGDSGYPLRSTVMTPFLNAAEGTPEAFYYDTHVSARNVVERCIGVMKARFRCLLAARVLHYRPEISGLIVNACAVLHNMANKARLAYPKLTVEEEDIENNLQIQHNAAVTDMLTNIEVPQTRTNAELQQGRAAQQALIRRIWMEHNHN